MKKDQITGFIIIGILFMVWMYYVNPSKEEVEIAKQKQDSIVRVHSELERERAIQVEKQNLVSAKQQEQRISTEQNQTNIVNDLQAKYGNFAQAAAGEQEFIYIENDVVKLKISTKGGRVFSAELKEYQTHDSLPLILFDGDSTVFGFSFYTPRNLLIQTNEMFFEPQTNEESINASSQTQTLALRLKASENSYVEYIYTLTPGSYMVDFDIRLVGMGQEMALNQSNLYLDWQFYLPGQEKGRTFEDQYSGIYFKHYQDEVDYLTETSEEDSEKIPTKVKWIAFKQQFFSTVLIADDYFSNADVYQNKVVNDERYLKFYRSSISLPYKNINDDKIEMRFYFGPNHFSSLQEFDIELQKLVPLGWGIFGWVNRFAVIPIFNFLGSFITSYGLIIFLLTLIIKLVLFPLTYKSYMSSAKMRVLKPQVEELTKNIPKDKAMEKQQKTMALYKKAGVNPMGGCLPMLLQMPILFAMFRFFPTSIELRQKSFLWATDLSSYDSIYNLPFDIPFYGDHVSLFTLLMTISTIIYTRMNQNQMGDASTQMPGMKMMMYMFPVMMLFWFNSYASGLSYYYFLANMITFTQMYMIKRMVDEKSILKKLEANKKKPVKKSNFQARIEKMAKDKGYNQQKRKK